MPFFLRGRCFFLFLTEPRRSLWTSPLPPPRGCWGTLGLYLCHHYSILGGLVETPFVAYWPRLWGCARWIKKKPLIVFTFQEVKCFSNQKQKDFAQAGQACISVKGETTELCLPRPLCISPWVSLPPPHHVWNLPFLIFLQETFWPGPALSCTHSVVGVKAARQGAPVCEEQGWF